MPGLTSHGPDARYALSRMLLYAVTMAPLGTRAQFHRHDHNSQPWIGMRALTSDRALSRRLKGYEFFRRLNRSSNEAKTVRRGDTARSPFFELFIRLLFPSLPERRAMFGSIFFARKHQGALGRDPCQLNGLSCCCISIAERVGVVGISLQATPSRHRGGGVGTGGIKAIAFARCGKGVRVCRLWQFEDLIWPRSPGARCPMLGF